MEFYNMNQLEESIKSPNSKVTISRTDLIYPFVFILFMLSSWSLIGAIVGLFLFLIKPIEILSASLNIGSESVVTILNLAVTLSVQISAIVIFIIFERNKKIEPEEKRMPPGNHGLTAILVYSMVMVFTFFVTIIDSYLESLEFPYETPYAAIEPNLELLSTPIYLVFFFGSLVIGAAIWEELVFRRALIPFLERRGLGTFWVLVFSGLMFSLIHTPQDLLNGSIRYAISHFLGTTAMGIALGFLYMRTRDIRWPIAFHGLNNAFSGIMMIGLTRYEEFGEFVLIGLGGMWILGAWFVGGATWIYVIIQFFRLRKSSYSPAWLRIFSDFNIQTSRFLPILVLFTGYIFIESGIPLIFDFIFGIIGTSTEEFILLQYMVEISYLAVFTAIFVLTIFKLTEPLKKADWVSALTFPEISKTTIPYVYVPRTTGIQRYCGNCGRETLSDTRFCVFCGSNLDQIQSSDENSLE
jgi:membrane protease YdiL (CAAX protease family)